jgi:GNAT superfamily N-acetyltransferase
VEEVPVSPEGIAIVVGGREDLERIEPLWLLVHTVHRRSAPELAPWVDDEMSWERKREHCERCLAHPDSFLLLALRGSAVLGYALVTVEPDGAAFWNDSWPVGDRVAEVESFAVVEEEQRRGIGTRLLDAAEAELERRGIHDLVVGAVPGNPAIEFYKGRGFVPSAVILSRFAARRHEGDTQGRGRPRSRGGRDDDEEMAGEEGLEPSIP